MGASAAPEIKLLLISQKPRVSSRSPLICLKPKNSAPRQNRRPRGGSPTAGPSRSSGNHPRVKLDKLPERESSQLDSKIQNLQAFKNASGGTLADVALCG